MSAVSFISCILFAALAVFLLSPQPAAAAARNNAGPGSLAFSIIDMVNQRLCDRQAALGNRLRIQLIHPSKCVTAPPADEPVVTLTANPMTISVGSSTTLTWTSEDATSCTASGGWTGSKALNGSQSVSPTVTTNYHLDCSGPGGVGGDDVTVTVTVVQEPADPTVDITANPMTINQGSSTLLTWNSEDADTCTASNGWTGDKAVDGTQSVSPNTTTTYAISCTGDGGTVNDSVTVTVNPVTPNQPTVDLQANPTSVTPGAGSATTTLSWTSTNATSCAASGGWAGSKILNGSQILTPSATTTYTLTCTGAGGSASDSATVNFVPTQQETGTLTVRKVVIRDDGGTTATSTFTFQVNSATAVAFEGDGENSMTVNAGTYSVTEPAVSGWTTTYNNCSNVAVADDETEICIITNNDVDDSEEPTLTFSASRTTVNEGSAGNATSTLTWDSTNADSCTSSNAWTGARNADGSFSVTPTGTTTTTYVLTCTGDGGSVTQSVTITVVPEAEDEPTVSITASRTTVNEGSVGAATTTLSWDSTNADTCVASNGWTGDKAADGSETVTPTATTTYAISCTGDGGTANDSVTVNFVSEDEEPAVNHLLISEVYYDVGGVHGSEASAASANEWFELYNPTNSQVDLTNWWIMDATTLDKIPNGTTIPAGGRLVITATSTTSAFWGNTSMVVLGSAIGAGLANGGDALSLLNANGATTTVDALSWGTDVSAFSPSVPISGDDNSLVRTSLLADTNAASDWATLNDPTPGL